MSDSPQQQLTDIEAAVQTAVDAGEWERAAALEIEFRAALAGQIEALHGASPADLAALRSTLETAVARVQRLIGEVAHHERRLVRDATMISTGRRAAAAYASASGTE